VYHYIQDAKNILPYIFTVIKTLNLVVDFATFITRNSTTAITLMHLTIEMALNNSIFKQNPINEY
jgi:hypothetical protein